MSSGNATGNTFITGVAIPVPPGGFPTGLQNVQWSAAISTDSPSITSVQWQWSAGVYSNFNSCFAYQSSNSSNPCYNSTSNGNLLEVIPEDGSAEINVSDPAGTPGSYKQYLTGAGFFSAPGNALPASVCPRQY